MRAFVYGSLFGIAVGFGIAALVWRESPVVPTERTRIVYRSAPRPPRITVPPMVTVRTVYDRRVDTVEVRIPVPVDFGPRGVIGTDPISISRTAVRFQYWNPDSLRFIEDRYELRQPRFGYGINYATYAATVGDFAVGIGLFGRIDRWTMEAGPVVTGRGPALAFRIGYRILGVN